MRCGAPDAGELQPARPREVYWGAPWSLAAQPLPPSTMPTSPDLVPCVSPHAYHPSPPPTTQDCCPHPTPPHPHHSNLIPPKHAHTRAHTQVIVSLAACAAFAFIALPTLVHFTGFAGLVKYWLMPWLGYHFWMSTFTIIHHTAPHIPFKPAEEWNAAKAQLSGTVHCDFPGW